MIAIRFGLFVDLMAVFGIAAFGLHALRGAERRSGEAIPLASVLLGGVSLGALLSIGAIVAMAAQMSGVAPTAVDVATVRMLIVATPMGAAWCVRMGALAIAALAVVLTRSRPTLLMGIVSAVGLVALATLVWAGHGAMDGGAIGWVHLAADVLHLAAAGLWTGTLLALTWLLRVHPTRVALLQRVLTRFAAIGTAIVLTLLVTGIVNGLAIVGLPPLASLMTSDYAGLLAAKILLFGGMLLLAALNRFRLTPALAAGGTVQALRRSLAAETGAVLLVLALVAWLGTLAPPGSA